MAKLSLKVKKRTIKDDADLFAKELNLNPKDYKIGKIIDIALKTIKSSDNPLVMERIRSIKSNLKKAMQDIEPYIDQAKIGIGIPQMEYPIECCGSTKAKQHD